MRKSKVPTASQGNADDIEAAFYEALNAGDIDKLMACWADEDDVVCVHPGGPRLVGIGVIRASFEALFTNGVLRAHAEKIRRVESMAASIHSVLERIEILSAEGVGNAYVIATNVYHKTAQGWRLVAHHASPGTTADVQAFADAAATLH